MPLRNVIFGFNCQNFKNFFFLKIQNSPKIDKILIPKLFLKAPVRKPVGDELADILIETHFNF